MPNWCENKLVVKGNKEALEKFLNECFTSNNIGDSHLDFQKIIPMPDSLDVENSSLSHNGLLIYVTDNVTKIDSLLIPKILNKEEYEKLKTNLGSHFDEAYELGKQLFQNILDYGSPTWYEWRLEHWDTKWNSDSCSITEDEEGLFVWFNTAWGPCRPIIRKLTEMYPELVFEYSYFEPGCWFGGTILQNSSGDYEENYIEDSSLLEFALEYDFIGEEEYDYYRNGGDD
jgi:hypothetical protein